MNKTYKSIFNHHTQTWVAAKIPHAVNAVVVIGDKHIARRRYFLGVVSGAGSCNVDV